MDSSDYARSGGMSDFGEHIRAARVSARTAQAFVTPAERLVEVPAPVEPPAPARKELERRDADGALEAQRRLVDELSRKIEALNAAVLQEILRDPRAAEAYPRTVALLADALAGRVNAEAEDEDRKV